MSDTDASKKKLLVVEDDHELRMALELRMAEHFEVRCVQDGVSAMAAAKNFAPDVILLDLGLPAGDGFRVLEWKHQVPSLSFVPTVVLSGRDGFDIETQVRALGAVAFLQKPAEHEELLAILEDCCRQNEESTRKRILVVEDDADVRAGLGIWLRARGYEVDYAADGVTALSKSRSWMPHGILLDLGLPAGDGISFLERLHGIEELEHIPTLVLSGRDAGEAEPAAVAAGARGYLSKPPDEATLLAAIEEVF